MGALSLSEKTTQIRTGTYCANLLRDSANLLFLSVQDLLSEYHQIIERVGEHCA